MPKDDKKILYGDGARFVGGRRADGYKRCVWTIQRTREAYEAPSGVRRAHARRGERCHVMVTPKQQASVGLPICPKHEPFWREEVARDAATRKRLRDKYDPGPQYEED